VRIFLRLLLALWAAMLVLATVVVFISPLASSLQDERLRRIPIAMVVDEPFVAGIFTTD
jgi:hypothetical protein